MIRAIFFCFIFCGNVAHSANILAFAILGSFSHRLSMWPYLEDLVASGHNVTFMSSYPPRNPDPHSKIHDVVPKLWKSRLGDFNSILNFYELRAHSEILKAWASLPSLAKLSCESLYEDDEIADWIRSMKMDIVVVDVMMNECAYGLAYHWNAKVIVYSTANVMSWFQDTYGMPDETSSLTDPIFSWQTNHKMHFLQRFVNAVTPLVWKVIREWYHFPKLEKATKEGLERITGKPVRNMPTFAEIERNVSLIMISSHYSMSFPRSLPPNMVEVGGLMVPPGKPDPLPKDLEEFIGNSDFMYVSLGSIVEFSQIPESKQKAFVETLESFPEIKFIWKSNQDILLPLPKNVKVLKWAPQLSLLDHPKIKGFVTHAGLGSTTEAIHFGVPTILFPVFAEQDMNAAFMAERGAGILLELTDIRKEVFVEAVRNLLENPTFGKAVKILSTLIKERETNPTRSAVWWTEFVLRHDNPNDFLQPPSVQQSWWVKRQIDVWVVFSLMVLFIVFTPVFIVGLVCKRILFSKKTTKKIKKQ